MEINVFCLFGKIVKLHLLVSPYRCVPSVAVTRITAVDFHWRWWEPRRRLPRGCRKRLGHGVEGRYGGCLVQLHNNIQEFTDCEQSPFSPALTGEALKNAEHWNWLPTVSVDNSLEEMLFIQHSPNITLCWRSCFFKWLCLTSPDEPQTSLLIHRCILPRTLHRVSTS